MTGLRDTGNPPVTELTFASVVHAIREKLVELQNAPHEEHAGSVCPICVLTNRMLARLQEQSDA